jgi:hypothetical protein
MPKVDVQAFGFLLGGLWGAGVLSLGIAAMLLNRGRKVVDLFSSVYIGYAATWPGSFIGAVWGFFDGLISGIVIAWIYNKIFV